MTSNAYISEPPAAATPTAIARLWRGDTAPSYGCGPAYPTWPQAKSGAGGGDPLAPRRSRQGVSGWSGAAALVIAIAIFALAVAPFAKVAS
jgi:hypothetical protein